jgi:hypothetical protein
MHHQNPENTQEYNPETSYKAPFKFTPGSTDFPFQDFQFETRQPESSTSKAQITSISPASTPADIANYLKNQNANFDFLDFKFQQKKDSSTEFEPTPNPSTQFFKKISNEISETVLVEENETCETLIKKVKLEHHENTPKFFSERKNAQPIQIHNGNPIITATQPNFDADPILIDDDLPDNNSNAAEESKSSVEIEEENEIDDSTPTLTINDPTNMTEKLSDFHKEILNNFSQNPARSFEQIKELIRLPKKSQFKIYLHKFLPKISENMGEQPDSFTIPETEYEEIVSSYRQEITFLPLKLKLLDSAIESYQNWNTSADIESFKSLSRQEASEFIDMAIDTCQAKLPKYYEKKLYPELLCAILKLEACEKAKKLFEYVIFRSLETMSELRTKYQTQQPEQLSLDGKEAISELIVRELLPNLSQIQETLRRNFRSENRASLDINQFTATLHNLMTLGATTNTKKNDLVTKDLEKKREAKRKVLDDQFSQHRKILSYFDAFTNVLDDIFADNLRIAISLIEQTVNMGSILVLMNAQQLPQLLTIANRAFENYFTESVIPNTVNTGLASPAYSSASAEEESLELSADQYAAALNEIKKTQTFLKETYEIGTLYFPFNCYELHLKEENKVRIFRMQLIGFALQLITQIRKWQKFPIDKVRFIPRKVFQHLQAGATLPCMSQGIIDGVKALKEAQRNNNN